MASGTWSEFDIPERAGFYMRLKARALAAIRPGNRGTLAIPVRANWGPIKEVVKITSEADILRYFGSDRGDFTAYKALRLALVGQPRDILAYRLDDGSAKQANASVKNNEGAEVGTLRTKYPTEKPFNYSVQDDIVDSDLQTLSLYEGTRRIYTVNFAKGDIEDFANVINGDQTNEWVIFNKKNGAEGDIENVANAPLSSGDAGVSGITNADYIDAMQVFETRKIHAFALDGVADSSLQTSVKAWVERLRSHGKKVIAYVGGSLDDTPSEADERSKLFNSEGMVNATENAVFEGEWISSAFVACWAAGFCTGQQLSESPTHADTPFTEIKPIRKHDEVLNGLRSGSFMLTYDDDENVIVEKGINTLTSLTDEQNNAWRFIKTVRIMDAIDLDLSAESHQKHTGKVPGNSDGHAAIISAYKNYFALISPTLVASDYVVAIDEELQRNAEGDQLFWYWDARVINNVERIYGTGHVRY
ncbi:hypothetical protein AJ85_05645 [Alkalihalobacillus alcalophilus ATCC 27647 = CGMCC 1.3604]|uniref:Uncharacterized protein n=1 Tax=Alkalihalobacillus alcalophilus ATCC 27647 = CGMCC 1.3604 TaxID=1218173 RepID=A0A094YTR8_ALKAL|nr:phage tail sheath subtilisin-like domain-containing protein [Alkalihalobacillus alcalophilus]YP_009276843.1 tail sheath [Bacillus phage BalMu-1]AJA42415.1 XkdK [Bacillus phage BalMu-1]AJA42471.1 XkdK [Bacillus phage BalMu-1]KGA96867.1 hypothetical protein BALCAV_0213705 [Alkalihalobacillus alcalophilus ATCC 27647 = CGMCC 1.3604]MED1561157.1 phage tail sheath subtilisin-like domain-containing protein [Alkalihalobacillus alcalophilus]THG91306.1 hypothetical protein AJ85_05645 [Alkalihalobaci